MAPARRFGPAVARKSTFTPIRDPYVRRDDADPEILPPPEWEPPAESLDVAGTFRTADHRPDSGSRR